MTQNNNNDGEENEIEQIEDSSNENNTDISSVPKDRMKQFILDQILNADGKDTEANEADSNQLEDQPNEGESQNDDSDSTEQEEGNEVLSQSDEDDSDSSGNLSRGVKKRIDKLTAKRREAEAEIVRLKQELEETKSSRQVEEVKIVDQKNPFANLNTSDEIAAEIAQARSVKRWCEEHSDGYTVTNEDGTERTYSREEITQIKLNALDALEEHLPARQAYIRTHEQVEPIAKKEYGNIWNSLDSRERKIANAFVKAFPEVTKFPDWKMIVGDYISGLQSRESRSKNGQKTIKKAPVNPNPSSTAPKATTADRVEAAQRRFSKTGDKSDLKEILLNKFL